MKQLKRVLAAAMSAVMILGIAFAVPTVSRAAGFSVSSALSGDLQSQLFTISNPSGEALFYDVQCGDAMQSEGTPVPSGGTTLSFHDINAYYAVYVYTEDGEEVSAVSPASHEYQVTYDLAGTSYTPSESSGDVYQGESFDWPADEEVKVDGIEYVLAPGQSAQQTIYFGMRNYEFQYVKYEPSPEAVHINYVDTSGNVIGGQSGEVSYYGGNAVFTLPAEVDYDGKAYEKTQQTNQITVNYNSPQLDYDIMYQLKNAPAEGPYSVEVIYQLGDGTDAVFLGNSYYTVNPKTSGEVTVSSPDTLAARAGGAVTYYEAVDATTINHDTASDVRQYVVHYEIYNQKKPYQWSVRLVNASTGAILSTESKKVNAEESVSYDVDSVIKADGKNYILDAGMKKQYIHQYGDDRILNIFYNEEGKDAVSSYQLNVRYKSVSTDETLYETTQNVTPGAAAVLSSPEEYAANDTNYVKLAGQEADVTHDFYNARRNYTVYYRDVNDLQNIDTVVTQEEIVESTIFDEENVPETAVTVLTNDTTGEQRTLTDEGVPLADVPTDTNEQVKAADDEVPLAKSLDKGGNSLLAMAGNHPLATGLVLLVIIGVSGLLGFFFWKKKKKAEQMPVE